jgi:hypothetical protein
MASTAVNQQSVAKGVELHYQTLLVGLQTLAPTQQLAIDGTIVTPTALSQQVQTALTVYKAARPARVTWQQAIAARKAQAPSDTKLVAGIKQALFALLGEDNPSLASFGFKPRKPKRKLTAQEQALAVAQGRETRAARHTLGTRQKADIQGPKPQQVSLDGSGAMTIVPVVPPKS